MGKQTFILRHCYFTSVFTTELQTHLHLETQLIQCSLPHLYGHLYEYLVTSHSRAYLNAIPNTTPLTSSSEVSTPYSSYWPELPKPSFSNAFHVKYTYSTMRKSMKRPNKPYTTAIHQLQSSTNPCLTQFINHFVSLSWSDHWQNLSSANKVAQLKHIPSPWTSSNQPTRR